jgi:hypothetical protein
LTLSPPPLEIRQSPAGLLRHYTFGHINTACRPVAALHLWSHQHRLQACCGTTPLNHDQRSLNHNQRSLNHDQRSLNHDKRSLNHDQRSPGHITTACRPVAALHLWSHHHRLQGCCGTTPLVVIHELVYDICSIHVVRTYYIIAGGLIATGGEVTTPRPARPEPQGVIGDHK